MTGTKQYQPPYSLAEIEEMGKLIDAKRYAEYHAYNWRHRGRDWSRHAANIVAGYGPDAAYVRAYLHSYFEGRMSDGERMNMSAKIAEEDFKNIKGKDGVIPNDRDAAKHEVVKVMEEKLKLPKESFPGTLTYGEMVGAETSDNVVNDEKVWTATLAGLAAMRGASTEPPEGTVVDEKGIITDDQGEFVGIEGDDVNWIEEQVLSSDPAWALRTLDEMHGVADLPGGLIGVPMWDTLPPPEKKVGPGAAPPSPPPVAAPEIEDSLVAPTGPQSISAPAEERGASASDVPIPNPSPTPGEAQEIAAPMPDPLRTLLPGLDRGPAIEVPALATPAPPATDRPLVAHEIEATPQETSVDPGERRIDAAEVKERVAQPAAEAESDVGFDFDAAEEALEAEIAAALTAIEKLRLARSRYPGMLVDRDRDVIRLTSISATASSDTAETGAGDADAGGSPNVRQYLEPRFPDDTPRLEARMHEIARKVAREELAARDRRIGVNFRDSPYIRFPRG